MTAPRFTRDLSTPADPWPIVDRWASAQGYRPISSGVGTRTYRKGAGFWVGARMVQVAVDPGVAHLEAWVAGSPLVEVAFDAA